MVDPDIREARAEDFPVIAAIYNEAIERHDASMDERLKTADEIAGWVANFHARERLLVLEEDGQVVAWGILKRYSDREGYRFACETAVYVTSSRLRRGYGSRLKVEMLHLCRELGYHHLVAKIFAQNEASIGYNLQLGYDIVGRQREIGYYDGRWIDVVIMQLVLDDVAPKDNGEET